MIFYELRFYVVYCQLKYLYVRYTDEKISMIEYFFLTTSAATEPIKKTSPYTKVVQYAIEIQCGLSENL